MCSSDLVKGGSDAIFKETAHRLTEETAHNGQRSELIPLPPHNIMIVEGVLIFKIPALCRSANLTFWVEAPLEVAAARQGARWKHEGGCPGIPEEEVRWRIGSKRTEEVPLIMAQRRRCDWVIDNAGEVRRRAFPTPAILGIP